MEKNNELLMVLILIVALLILGMLVYHFFANRSNVKEKDLFLKKSLDLKELQVKNLQAINESLEIEREKFATAIQDEIDPLLVTLQLNINKYKKDLQANRLRIEDLDYCQQFVDSVVTNLRITSHSLAPQKMLQHGIFIAFQDYFSRIESPIVHFSSSLVDSRFLSKNQMLNLYHIGIEVANSMCKYDLPSVLNMRLEVEDSDLVFYFSHEKTVLNLSIYPSKYNVVERYALDSIQARLLIVNAKIFFQKQESGTTVVVKLPFY